MNPLPHQSEKRRRKPPSPPPPPPPRPPPPCNPPALELHLPKHGIRPAPDANSHHSHEKPEKPQKVEKIKSEKKFPVNPNPNPPNPPLLAEIPNHEPKRGRSKDDSKQRPSEHKPSRSAIVNAFGLLPQSERRNKKNPIPTPPVPPPLPPPLSSTLHKWFQSYNKRDSKHKSKDSEPSPRLRSDKSRRKVHSSNSPPSPTSAPLPPAHVYTTEPTYPKKRASEKHEKPKPPIYSTDSNYTKNVETSKKIEAPKLPVYTPDPGYQKVEGFEEIVVAKKTSGRRNSSEYWKANVSGDAITPEPLYQKDEGFDEIAVAKKTSGRRNSSEYWKSNVSGDAITPDPWYQKDEGFDEIAVSKRVSGRRNSSEYWKENVSGDAKATEKLAERKSSTIPLPPPPPPPFPLVEHHWSFYDDPKLQKKKVPSPGEVAEAESVQEPEIGWASVFRKQFSLDNADSPFCPSPSPDEVNRKADAFIARMHQQLRLQKSNSGQGRLN